MGLPPELHPRDIHRPPKIVPVLRFGQPAALAGGFAGLSAGRLRTVFLMADISRIGSEQLTATQALMQPWVFHGSTLLAADHQTPTRTQLSPRKTGTKRKKTQEAEEDPAFKKPDWKKTDEEYGVSNRPL